MALAEVIAYISGPVAVGRANVYQVSSELRANGGKIAVFRDLAYSYGNWCVPDREEVFMEVERDLRRRVDGAIKLSASSLIIPVDKIDVKIQFKD